MVSAVKLVRAAAQAAIRVLCITDHDTITDLTPATEVGHELGVDLVAGEEITASFPPGIHIVGLFLEKQVRMHMSVEDTVDAIHDHGGLAVIAHPFMPTWFASITPRRALQLLEHTAVDGIEIRHTAPVPRGTWRRLDLFYAKDRERLGAALGAGDSHFGEHDLGRIVTVFQGSTARDLRAAIESRATSPLLGWSAPPKAPLSTRLAQQYRAMVWLSGERRARRVGTGVGPKSRR
jgi:hypothetical protein